MYNDACMLLVLGLDVGTASGPRKIAAARNFHDDVKKKTKLAAAANLVLHSVQTGFVNLNSASTLYIN